MREVELPDAVKALREGKMVLYPTETFYGLGVDIQNPQAVKRLFALKGREESKPVSVLVPDEKFIKLLVKEIKDKSLILIKKFLPGPLTLVLPASEKVSAEIHAHSGWVGIRMSSHAKAQALVHEFGSPISTTSANPSGGESAIILAQVRDYFMDQEDVYLLSGGDLPPSKGSTVVKVEGDSLILLREGEIPFVEIEKEFGSM